MSKRSHVLQGILVVFESQVGSDIMLHFYGFGRGPLQDPGNPLSGLIGNPMDQAVWTGNAKAFGWNEAQGIARVMNGNGVMVTTQIGNRHLPDPTR
ncbi:MAG TPA: hypothetical protein DHW63_02300 [Hyphomonadaceae bacterium]|nr:hypothetical protein [Hyphomonadaceae bacterium]